MTKKQDITSENDNKEAEISDDNVAENEAQSSDNDTASGASDVDLQAQVASLQKELEQAKAKAEENWEHFVRTKADLENLERRSQRDIENAHKYAGEKLLEAMIPVIDSLEMGAEAAKQDSADVAKMREGMELTLKMFADTLSKFEVVKLDPTGDMFNPEYHQAMTMQESSEHAANTVLSVMQKGYLLNERLIRPALVVVSKPSGKSNKAAKGGQNNDDSADVGASSDAPEDSLGNTVDEKA